jgi:rhodanese-related sulfurtransferase
MMKNTIHFLWLFIFGGSFVLPASAQIFEDLTVAQCDSVINANYDNPNFVIIDVRTAGEYAPQHLEDAINIDFYAADFSEQLDQLNKEKTYLIHCKSGARSGVTFDLMQTLEFQEVYNMLGGMNTWNAASLPTTDAFAPRFMFVSESHFSLDTVALMSSDTLELTITNRGNSMLDFEAVSSLADTEFYSDFDLDATLWGAEDYTFQIIYSPEDEMVDSLLFVMESNIGFHWATLVRVGQDLMVDVSKVPPREVPGVFPNPVKDRLFFTSDNLQRATVQMYDATGRLVTEKRSSEPLVFIDVSQLWPGIYFVRIIDTGNEQTFKVLVRP